jgi:predicted nucleic acid-binding protein
MLVVSDSSPLNFLIRMGHIDVLETLFGEVLIPPMVEEELTRPTTPAEVRNFIAAKPAWLRVQSPSRSEPIARLDPGEAAAINLSLEVHADVLLVDDGNARRAALQRGLVVVGLLGILDRADEKRLLEFSEVVKRFPSDYRIESGLVEEIALRCSRRRAAE